MAQLREMEALHFLSKTPVLFLGFRSDVASLYSQGWKIHTDYEAYSDRTRLAFAHQQTELASTIAAVDMMENHRQPIVITNVGRSREMHYQTYGTIGKMSAMIPMMNETVDMRIHDTQRLRLFDLLDFEQPQELIVEPQDVQFMLDKIINAQRPVQKDLRDKARTVKKTEAKIITLMEYRS